MIGDVETVPNEFAGALASALATLLLTVVVYEPEQSEAWNAELMALRERFPENRDVVSRADDTARAIREAVAEANDMQRRRNSPLGRLKRLFGF